MGIWNFLICLYSLLGCLCCINKLMYLFIFVDFRNYFLDMFKYVLPFSKINIMDNKKYIYTFSLYCLTLLSNEPTTEIINKRPEIPDEFLEICLN